MIPYALPFREPYVTARGRIERRELVLFRLTGEDGAVGLGETTSLSLRGGIALPAIIAELEEIGTRLTRLGETDAQNDTEGTRTPWEAIGLVRCSAEAFCAWSMAVTDLGARGAELQPSGPIEPIPCNATLSTGPPGLVAEHALSWREKGFDTFKLKLGAAEDVEQVTAVREALGEEVRLRIDVNGAWSKPEAKEKLCRLEPLRIELCEQPVQTREQMAELRPEVGIPIAADETVSTAEDARLALEMGACDLVTLKLAKCGGMKNALRIANVLPAYVSSALEGPVGIAAAGHAAAELTARGGDAGIAHGLATQLLFSETIAAQGPEVRDGFLHLPPGPGLGVEIDEEALQRHRL